MKGGVYILPCGNGQYYVGSVNDLERRIAQHKAGKVIATKGKLPYTRVGNFIGGKKCGISLESKEK